MFAIAMDEEGLVLNEKISQKTELTESKLELSVLCIRGIEIPSK